MWATIKKDLLKCTALLFRKVLWGKTIKNPRFRDNSAMSVNAILLTPQSPREFSGFLDRFHKLLPEKMETQFLTEMDSLQDLYVKESDPAIVFVDISFSGLSDLKPLCFHSLFSGIRRLDPHACILMLTDRIPETKDLMGWMDHGATGILNIDFHEENLSDSIREMLEVRLELHRKNPRAPAKHKIQIQMDSLEQAVVAETLNVGYGGFFVRAVLPNAMAGDRVEFEFLKAKELGGNASVEPEDINVRKVNAEDQDLSGEDLYWVKGMGRVSWIRSLEAEDSPAGMGIEFVELDEKSEAWIHAYVSHRRIHAFIPKS